MGPRWPSADLVGLVDIVLLQTSPPTCHGPVQYVQSESLASGKLQVSPSHSAHGLLALMALWLTTLCQVLSGDLHIFYLEEQIC